VGRYNADLTDDMLFNTKRGVGISNAVQADYELDRVNVAALQGENIIVGGSFGTFSGLAHQNLVRLEADGTPDAGFVTPAFAVFNFRSEVFALAAQPDGRILVGGRFSSLGGVSNPSLARLNANGTLDTSFHSPFPDAGANVYALALQPDGKILVGGDVQFTSAGPAGTTYTGLFRLNPDGSRDDSFTASVKPRGVVKALAFTAPNQALVGGSFMQVDGLPRQALARYLVDTDPVTLAGNYVTGAPGSYFTLTAQHFFPNAPLQIVVNGHTLGSLQSGADGTAVFILQSTLADDPGAYCVRLMLGDFSQAAGVTQGSAVASFWIYLSPTAPQRAKDGSQTAISIPAGIAFKQLYLPAIRR
jgi:uncharacterized delta-60 repeat protein